MLAWRTWILSAWIGLTFCTGIAGVVDGSASDDRGSPIVQAGDDTPSATFASSPSVRSTPLPARDATSGSALPVAVSAPAVGLSAPLVPTGKTDDGALAVPDFGTAGWYHHSARPGTSGAAVLAGHVDSRSGPDVFYALKDLTSGDEISVELDDGDVAVYVVESIEETDKDALPVERIFDDPDESMLRLITCGGAFDRTARSYESNVIVYARMIAIR